MGEDWMKDAACTTSSPDLWFPEVGNSIEIRNVKAICKACPVKDVCLEYALDNRVEHGIWGGLSAYERKVLLRGLKAKK